MHAKGRAYLRIEAESPAQRRERLVRRLLTWCGVGVGGALAAFALVFIYFGSDVRTAELARLQAANQALGAENQRFRDGLAGIVDRVGSLQETLTELSVRASIDEGRLAALNRVPGLRRPRHVGEGSGDHQDLSFRPALPATPEDMFGALRDSVSDLESRAELLQAAYAQRDRLLAATPMIWPAHGWLSAAFGRRPDPFSGKIDFHEGIDISAEPGRVVYATAEGRVERAEYRGGYGNTIVVDHGFGLATRYAHLSRFAVRVGDHVRRGQVIGFIGTTGKSTGPHLHYEIWANGRLMNPLRLILDRLVARR